MNYGRKEVAKRHKKVSSKAGMGKKKTRVRLLKGFLLCMLFICILGVGAVGMFVKKMVDNAPVITADSIKPQGYTSVILADDSVTETDNLKQAGSNRVYKTIDEIPKDLQHAFVAIEDSRFYTHHGIDPQGIIRAAVVGVANKFHFTEGASTITQQLIKNNVFPEFVYEETLYDRVERKVQEQYLALQVEKQLDKDEILESYLNTINLGQNTLGVQAASQRYFGKDVSELTLSECATIAGITKNPSAYNPITNPEANAKRRKKVLGDMLDQGYISQEEYDEAMADDVYSRIQTVNTKIQETSSVMSYFNDALVEQLMEDMTDPDGLGYTTTQAANAIYSGGLTIYSTQNVTMQKIAEKELQNDDNFPANIDWGLDYALTITRADGTQENYSTGHVKQFGAEKYNDSEGHLFSSQEAAKKRIEAFKESLAQEGDTYDEYINLSPQPQASVCIIEQSSGQIKALVGGRGEKNTSRGLNRAYRGSERQPGSCFKILAVYAPALDSSGLSLATVRKDEAYSYQTGSKKALQNAYSGYLGDITLRKAIEQSCNIVAVKVLNEISVNLGYEYVKNFGITTVTDDDRVESLALGGISTGVYNYELTAAYAAIANKGVYIEPILYTKVLDHEGNVLIDNQQTTKKVIQESTAALLTSAMQGVVDNGTAYNSALSNMDSAGKSGTTSNSKDYWFSGFTPYYTMSIWLGYDEPKEMPSSYWNYHFKLWAKIMNQIDEQLGLPYETFTMPSSITKKTVCSRSGLLPTEYCDETVSDYFVSNTFPTDSCKICEEGSKKICKETGLLASEYCKETEDKFFDPDATKKEDKAPTKTCEECKKKEEEAKRKEEEEKWKEEENKKNEENNDNNNSSDNPGDSDNSSPGTDDSKDNSTDSDTTS